MLEKYITILKEVSKLAEKRRIMGKAGNDIEYHKYDRELMQLLEKQDYETINIIMATMKFGAINDNSKISNSPQKEFQLYIDDEHDVRETEENKEIKIMTMHEKLPLNTYINSALEMLNIH